MKLSGGQNTARLWNEIPKVFTVERHLKRPEEDGAGGDKGYANDIKKLLTRRLVDTCAIYTSLKSSMKP